MLAAGECVSDRGGDVWYCEVKFPVFLGEPTVDGG